MCFCVVQMRKFSLYWKTWDLWSVTRRQSHCASVICEQSRYCQLVKWQAKWRHQGGWCLTSANCPWPIVYKRDRRTITVLCALGRHGRSQEPRARRPQRTLARPSLAVCGHGRCVRMAEWRAGKSGMRAGGALAVIGVFWDLGS